MKVKMIGRKHHHFGLSGGRPVCGASFCWKNIVAPMMIGQMPILRKAMTAGTSQGTKPKRVRMPVGSGRGKDP